MAAYAAVISLKQTIHRLLNSSQISIVSSNREILEFAYEEVTSLQKVLKRLDDCSSSERLNPLEGQIREALHTLEDLLEFRESDQFLSESENYGDEGFSHILSVEISSFAKTMKKMEEEYIKELDNPILREEEEDDDDDAVSSSMDINGTIVGLSDDFTIIKNQVIRPIRPYDFAVFSFVGMPGNGRTVAAATIVLESFYLGHNQYLDRFAWVTIGPDYQFKEILIRILAKIGNPDELLISEGDEKLLAEHLYTILEGRRYMIVLDDVPDIQIMARLMRSFPVQDNGSLVLLTTSLKEVARFADSLYNYEFRPMSEEMIRDDFCLAMFGEESKPPELDEAGKKIVRNCQGRYLALVKVILFLFNAEKTPEYWNKIAADTENSIFMVDDEISEMAKITEDMQQYDERNFTIMEVKRFLSLSSITENIKAQMFPERYFPKMEIISFFGMAGIGKTTLVKNIFEDPSILCCFNYHVWVTLGPKYQSKEILVDILAQIYPYIDKRHMKGDGELAMDLGAQLSYKRCLIVLDDVWNQEPLHYLKKLLPDIRGKVLLTTRLVNVAKFEEFDRVHEMRLLNKEESWSLLRHKVFPEGLCPPKLEKAGKKIAENCDGLPLTIVTVANLLSKVEKSPEYWDKVAEKQNSVFMDAHNEMSKALLPSYTSLPQHLKGCFLYMGVFPQNYAISCSNLIKLWIADGFLEPNLSDTVEDFAAECLSELVDKSLVMNCQKGSNFKIETCRLHSAFWHLSNSEAEKNKFFHALNTYAGDSREGIKSHRRLCIRNSILLGIKQVHNSLASVSTARSLLCTGPYHQYPVPIFFGLRLLRILDALRIRFYEFPVEVLKQIHLRYLALTCNEKIPASISKLCNLENLIINRHLSIKSAQDSSYLPMEIWDMKTLKHLQITGSNLPMPNCGDVLPNLSTLLNVCAQNCTKRVLQSIPNLKRLGIQIELAPYESGNPFCCLNHISLLHGLESLKCVVVNPGPRCDIVAPPISHSMFPLGLKKLSLSGLGYSWEYMSIIGKLRNLEVLKLRCYAFRGPEWEIDSNDFVELKFLLIEDTDLVRWNLKIFSFPALKCLSIKHCYKLVELPPPYLLFRVAKLEVVDCNPLAVTWANQMKQRMEEEDFNKVYGMQTFTLQVHSSWDAGNLKQ